MSALRQHIEQYSKKEIDHSLFDILKTNLAELGGTFIGNETRLFNFIVILEDFKRRPGKFNNVVKSFVDDSGELLLVGKLSIEKKGSVLKEIIEFLESSMNDLTNTPDNHPLLKTAILNQVSKYFSEKIILSHTYIFSTDFSACVNSDIKLKGTFNTISEIRDQLYIDCCNLSYSYLHKFCNRDTALKKQRGNVNFFDEALNSFFNNINSAVFLFQPELGLSFVTIVSNWINAAIYDFEKDSYIVKKSYTVSIIDEFDLGSNEEQAIGGVYDGHQEIDSTLESVILINTIRNNILSSSLEADEAELAIYFYQEKVDRITIMKSLNITLKEFQFLIRKWNKIAFKEDDKEDEF